MGVRGQTLAVDLLAEIVELVLGEPPEQEGARVDAWCRVPLREKQIPFTSIGARMPEVVVADIVEGRRRGKARYMAAHVRAPVRPQNHRERVPSHIGADAVLELVVPRRALFPMRRDGIDVRGIGAVGQIGA